MDKIIEAIFEYISLRMEPLSQRECKHVLEEILVEMETQLKAVEDDIKTEGKGTGGIFGKKEDSIEKIKWCLMMETEGLPMPEYKDVLDAILEEVESRLMVPEDEQSGEEEGA